ncbi:MAG: PGF-CTERM sorting domain-containing protein [Halobacteria archaeon]|nr:PGF-CTERM sorting domain-containing protein [Halobacteria archaeon]
MKLVKSAVFLVVVLSLVAVSVAVPVSAQDTPSITVEPQGTDGNSVTVPEATLNQSGWVVLHPKGLDGANPTQVLGKTKIEQGTNTDVKVSFDSELTKNQSVYAMLHYDKPADGDFTFLSNRSQDPPVKYANGSVVVDDFYVVLDDSQSGDQLAELRQEQIEEERQRQQLQERKQNLSERREQIRNEIQQLREQVNNTTNNGSDGGGQGTPGFTLVVALVALLSVSAIALRRR